MWMFSFYINNALHIPLFSINKGILTCFLCSNQSTNRPLHNVVSLLLCCIRLNLVLWWSCLWLIVNTTCQYYDMCLLLLLLIIDQINNIYFNPKTCFLSKVYDLTSSFLTIVFIHYILMNYVLVCRLGCHLLFKSKRF